MSDQLYTFAEVILNYNLEPCVHYNKHFMPLYLTCKTFYNKYFAEKWQVFDCDICYFRETICDACLLHNTKTCINCTCSACGISGNLTGCLPNCRGVCSRCPSPFLGYGYMSFTYIPIIPSLFMIPSPYWNISSAHQVEARTKRSNLEWHTATDISSPEQNLLIIDEIMARSRREKNEREKEEEIVVNNFRMSNFKATKYFENKKMKQTNITKNNYKHNGQQFRKQNQLKQPR